MESAHNDHIFPGQTDHIKQIIIAYTFVFISKPDCHLINNFMLTALR